MTTASALFSRPSLVFAVAILFRLSLVLYGRWQDANSAVKYTDIDYYVFTDAARYVAHGRSPYLRATYRYTPLLAWLLLPTTWATNAIPNHVWFESGKLLFAGGDIVTGWMIWRILVKQQRMGSGRALKYASLWLLNPMVANISTRGSSEGLLAVLVIALLWATLERKIKLAGVLLGLGVHFKIYPFIYAASIWWWLGKNEAALPSSSDVSSKLRAFFTRERIDLAVYSLSVFMGLNILMYFLCVIPQMFLQVHLANCTRYGVSFIEHSYQYHLTRIDHRHNFSVYNTILHINSAYGDQSSFGIESLAFLPQVLLSVCALPYLLATQDLASTMLAQNFAFVTFNKVCTSQVWIPPILHDCSKMLISPSISSGTWSFCHSIFLPRHCFSDRGWVEWLSDCG